MLIVTVLIATIISFIAIGYVVWPLYDHSALNLSFAPKDELQDDGSTADIFWEDERLSELIVRKDAVLLSIKELEFDHRTGKLSQQDFDLFNHRLRQQAVGLLRQIERRSPDLAQLDEQVEKDIAAMRETETVSAASETTSSPENRHCPTCNNPITSADNFCAKCGTNLSDTASA
ncbi:MAG: zinc ribbon domain-containing protein [Chloroflexota bacterium]